MSRFLKRGFVPMTMAFCLLTMVLACSPAAEQSASDDPAEDGAESSGTAAAATSEGEGKETLRHRPINRLGKARRDRGDLKLVYGQLSVTDHQELEKIFQEERFFEDILAGLNESLILPRDVPVRLEECDEVNAFYDRRRARSPFATSFSGISSSCSATRWRTTRRKRRRKRGARPWRPWCSLSIMSLATR